MKKIVIGNWKMNPASVKEAEALLKNVAKNQKDYKNIDVVICVPNIYLSNLAKIKSKIILGAQDVFYEESGAYTGEVSAKMLTNFKVKYCIVGHSERRAMGETNETCNKKIIALLKVGITPILCVGEKTRDESHEYLNIVKKQIESCLVGINKNLLSKIIIAYEPVWAIGINATRAVETSECQEMMLYIKKIIANISNPKIAHSIRVIYGGSVNVQNSLDLITNGNTDGFLVGRDSLNAMKFTKIIQSGVK
ncbi:MAG: triosephosphate isomerase [Patescibacteria group bacterium]|jgi:triosephosphate isomerase|nr:triosephosphate isomerase [Patescibacteria group bacterium]